MAHHAFEGRAMSFQILNLLKTLPAQDRQKLQWGVGALVLVLVWTFNTGPAIKTLREAPAQLQQLDAQTQSLKTMQTEALRLQKAARINPTDAFTLLQQSAAEVLGTGAKVNLEGGRATLTLSGVSAESLAQFLALARTKSHALPVEAHLQKFVNANSNGNASALAKSKGSATELWRGTLILNMPSS